MEVVQDCDAQFAHFVEEFVRWHATKILHEPFEYFKMADIGLVHLFRNVLLGEHDIEEFAVI